MRKLVLLAILSSLCSAYGSGWTDSGAWPSTNHFVFDSGASMYTVTNLYGYAHSEWWAQTSTTNYIPTLTNLTGLGDHTAPINGIQSDTRAWTNEYLTELSVDVATYLDAASTTNLYTNAYDFVVGGVTCTVTTTLEHRRWGMQTNLALNVIDMWGYDCYMAAQEKAGAKGSGEVGDSDKPRYYRDNYDNLVNLKDWAAGFITGAPWLSTNTDIVADSDVIYVTQTGILDRVNAPSNFFDTTFYQMGLIGGWYAGEGHVITSSFTIAAGEGVTATNTVANYCGEAVIIVGTNGQVVTSVCTNDGVLAGYYEGDYGYKYFPLILNELVWTYRVDGTLTNLVEYRGFDPQYSAYDATCDLSRSNAIALYATNTVPLVPDRYYLARAWRYDYSFSPPEEWSWYGDRQRGQVHLGSIGDSIAQVAELYIEMTAGDSVPDPIDFFADVDGLGLTVNTYHLCWTSPSAATNAWTSGALATTNNPITVLPFTCGDGRTENRDYGVQSTATYWWILKWAFDYSTATFP